MDIIPRKCGIKLEPPTLVLTYINQSTGKRRQRLMPLRNFSSKTGVSRTVEDLRENPRHKKYLQNIKVSQLEKLLMILQERMKGLSLNDSLGVVNKEQSIDPEENLNKLDDEELKHKKAIMDETFEKNRKKPDDPDFVYDVEIDFDNQGRIESSGWDSDGDSDLDF